MSETRATYSAAEVMEILGIRHSAFYAAVGRGDIPSIRIGKKVLVPKDALKRLLESADSAPSHRRR
jgi:excisionase family DNA binding protein